MARKTKDSFSENPNFSGNQSNHQSSPNAVTANEHFTDLTVHGLLIQHFGPSALDKIMLNLAFSAMHTGGHRHGAFLDAAATAAKCAIYITYMEEGKNLRLTGQLHHLEPKRVKAIVEEVNQALETCSLLKMLGSSEPSYLIKFPYLWLELYPWQSGQSRIPSNSLSSEDKNQIEAKLPGILTLPDAQIINDIQFIELLDKLHPLSQGSLVKDDQRPLSEAMTDHIKRRLIHSGTIMRIDSSWGVPFYALMRTFYAPVDDQERAYTAVEDTAHYFNLMRSWAKQQSKVIRILEELNIPTKLVDQAIAELDHLITDWANRHHVPDGEPFILQLVTGPCSER